jgi:hypothetical protein
LPQPESESPQTFDVAVLGASPFALLLAGSLASQHKLRVALIGERFSPLRLPPGLGLSVGPITRPDSWALLRRLESETLSLLGTIGAASAVARVPVTFRADLAASVAALEHMHHMALGHGIKAELLTGSGLVIRDAAMVSETALHPAIDAWLGTGVTRIETSESTLALPKRGVATIVTAGRSISASQIVLADDTALLTHLAAAQIPAPLSIAEAMVVLTSPARALPSGPTLFIDRHTIVSSRGRGLLVHLSGTRAADARLASSLEGELPLVRLAMRRLRRVESKDGAPLIGWLKEPKLFIAAGMGSVAPFLAPLVARAIANAALPEEKSWLAARDPAHAGDRTAIADLALGEAA